jgi:ribonuclease-3
MMVENNLNELEISLGYKFKNLGLLVEALSHPSVNHKYNTKDGMKKNYERLEFFGDAVLNFVISKILVMKYNKIKEGELAKRRAYLICKDAICRVANSINLGQYIIMTEGEEKSNGRLNSNNIENSFEAILAAIYLDGGIEVAEGVIIKLWSDLLKEDYDLMTIDPKTAVQEITQELKLPFPKYELISQTGSAHRPVFSIILKIDGGLEVIAEGGSKKEAEKKAAAIMLQRLRERDLK